MVAYFKFLEIQYPEILEDTSLLVLIPILAVSYQLGLVVIYTMVPGAYL